MLIQKEQLHQIMSPKKACQRGLEEYIVEQHFGDTAMIPDHKNNNIVRGSFVYMNNPIYRVGAEGDPAPNGHSSRHNADKNIKLDESALHILHPTIDSGSNYIPKTHMNMYWSSDRKNIPRVIGKEDHVEKDNVEMEEYNRAVENKRRYDEILEGLDRLKEYKASRELYFNSRDGDWRREKPETLGNGDKLYSSQRYRYRVDKIQEIETINSRIAALEAMLQRLSAPAIPPYNKVEETKPLVENFKNINNIAPYGHTQNSRYATVGTDKNNYNLQPNDVPGIDVEKFKVIGGQPLLLEDASPHFWLISVIIIGVIAAILYSNISK